jgi:predicted O-methyltransferase YrrM
MERFLMRKKAKLIRGFKKFATYAKCNENMVVVELGSFAGESTAIFASQSHIAKVYAIDPWMNGHENFYEMEKVEKSFDGRIKPYGDKVIKHKMTGDEALHFFEDESIDLVYIDAVHTYDAVKNDIQKWLPKIKKTGFISGHDWQIGQVRKAIIEILGEPHKRFVDNSWVFKVSDMGD